MNPALDVLWPYTTELVQPDELDQRMLESGVAPDLAAVRASWNATVEGVLREATLRRPTDKPYQWFGKRGDHSEHLGRLLAVMQSMQRTYPDAQW